MRLAVPEPRSTETRRKARAGLVCIRVAARVYWVPTDVAAKIERLAAKAAGERDEA
jgi:hypothetical protein